MTLLVGVVLTGCGASDVGEGADEESIQGGKLDGRDPAVGIVWMEGGGFCSGSLIAPDVVLTAGHCVLSPLQGFYTGEGKATRQLGPNPAGGLKAHAIVDQLPYPGYDEKAGCPNPTVDVGLIRLARPLAGVKPLPLAAGAPRSRASCRIVGYGMHDAGDGTVTVEQKRQANVSVVSVDEVSVLVDWKSGISDHGDSGGPLLCGGRIAGDTSCGTDGTGADHRQTYYARTDNVRDWITKTIASWK